MSAGIQMGPNAVKDPTALISALKTQQPAQNPGTPAERVNPDQQALENIKAAQISLNRAKEFTNDPHLQQALDIMAGTLSKALLKFDGAAVLQSLSESVQSLSPMGVPAPGAPGPMAPGQPPMGAPPGGPPMGQVTPPQAAPPFSGGP